MYRYIYGPPGEEGIDYNYLLDDFFNQNNDILLAYGVGPSTVKLSSIAIFY